MSLIYQLPMQVPGMVGVLPNQKFMVTGDSLATITAAGYLNQVSLESNPISNTDVLQILYAYNLSTTSGTYGIFTVSISGTGTITLVEWVNPGDVLLPVVSGDFANFNGTSGQIKDLGYSPSNAAKTKVVMASAATISGQLAQFNDTTGTIGDSGVTAASLTTALQTQTAIVTMTAAQVIAAYATPFQIVAAPASGFALMPIAAQIITVVATPFTAGGVAVLQWGTTVHGAGTPALDGTTPAAEITAAASQIYTQYGIATTTATPIATANGLGLFFSNATQAFATGTGSTVTIAVTYMVVPV